jgi:hypothetical protein
MTATLTDPGLTARLDLAVGDRLRLAMRATSPRRWWTVQALSEHFAVCVQQAPFLPKGFLQYTVLDWRNAVRGPCDNIGQGYGDGTYSREECTRMLAQFEAAIPNPAGPGRQLQVSHRNRVPLVILDHRPAP